MRSVREKSDAFCIVIQASQESPSVPVTYLKRREVAGAEVTEGVG